MADVRLNGLPTRVALWRIMGHLGVKTTLQMLDEEGGGDFTLDGLLNKLQTSGFEARCVQAQLNDLAHLRLPTLVLTHDDDWILLCKKKSNGWLVEHDGGVALVSEGCLAATFSGTALEISKGFPDRGGLWMRLLRLVPEHREFLLMSFGASLLAHGLALISPWLTARMVDGALAQGSGSLLEILCIGLILTAIFRAWSGWLRDITLYAFSTRIDVALEKGLFDHLLHLPFKHLQSKTLGELFQAFSGIKRARSLVLNRGLGSIFDALTAVAFLAYMAMLMPAVAGIVVLGAVVLSLTSVVIGSLQAREMRLQISAGQAQHSALAELIKGTPTLKAMGSQKWVMGRWRDRLVAELAHSLKQDRIGLWGEASNEFLSHGSSICILIWGGFKVLAGELSLGQLLAFSQLSGSFVAAVTNLSQTVLAIAIAMPQMSEVHDAFATPRQPRRSFIGPSALTGPVIAEDVWFRYEETGPWILEGINLRVLPGTFHHLKWASGYGKSTLLKLLAGLYLPDAGRISLGGLDSAVAAGQMAFLPQFPQLSSGSILENLRIFSGDRPNSHLLQVAKETGLDEWVSTLPMGYQTMVASGGGNFSGGQRQLVSITAVLASNKQLLLLDEALSNLDWVTRQRILHCPQLQGRTVIYASHEEVLLNRFKSSVTHCSESPPLI